MMFKHSRTTQRHDGVVVFVDTLTLPPRPAESVTGVKPVEYVLLIEVPEGKSTIRVTKSMSTGALPSMSISRKDLKDILTAVEWADAGPLGRLALEAKPIKRNKYLP